MYRQYPQYLIDKARNYFLTEKKSGDAPTLNWEFFEDSSDDTSKVYAFMSFLRKKYRKEGILFGLKKTTKEGKNGEVQVVPGRGVYGCITESATAEVNVNHHTRDLSARTISVLEHVGLTLEKFPEIAPSIQEPMLEIQQKVTDAMMEIIRREKNKNG